MNEWRGQGGRMIGSVTPKAKATAKIPKTQPPRKKLLGRLVLPTEYYSVLYLR